MDSFHKFLQVVYLENNTITSIKMGKLINHDATVYLQRGVLQSKRVKRVKVNKGREIKDPKTIIYNK